MNEKMQKVHDVLVKATLDEIVVLNPMVFLRDDLDGTYSMCAIGALAYCAGYGNECISRDHIMNFVEEKYSVTHDFLNRLEDIYVDTRSFPAALSFVEQYVEPEPGEDSELLLLDLEQNTD